MNRDLFATRLRATLIKKKMTSKRLAQEIGVTEKTICQWLNTNVNPNALNLIKMAQLLDVSVDYLIGLKEGIYGEY